jgi:DNA-binding CsgD family transcriptional regulator
MFRMLHLSQMAGIEPLIHQGPVPAFVTELLEAKNGMQVVQIVSEMVHRIGFEAFEYGSLLPSDADEPQVVLVSSTSREWGARYERMSYFQIDPRLQNCLRHVTPFLWDSTGHFGPEAEAFLSEAARYGLRSGIALPVGSGVGENAMVAVSGSNLTLPDGEELQLAIGRTYIFASYFHERLSHKLRKQAGSLETASPQVTKREREVLELAAHGQSSKRIAHELGIRESTVNYHIASIRRKFRARTRSHAVAQAVQFGLIR